MDQIKIQLYCQNQLRGINCTDTVGYLECWNEFGYLWDAVAHQSPGRRLPGLRFAFFMEIINTGSPANKIQTYLSVTFFLHWRIDRCNRVVDTWNNNWSQLIMLLRTLFSSFLRVVFILWGSLHAWGIFCG